MVKLIKIGDLVYQNAEEKTIDENGNEVWNIPSTVEELQPVVLDTINWWVGQKVKSTTGDYAKMSAANSKAIALLYKLVNGLNPDTSGLTAKEKQIYDSMQTLAASGYSDSDLLLGSIQSVENFVSQGAQLSSEAMAATDVDGLIAVLNKLD